MDYLDKNEHRARWGAADSQPLAPGRVPGWQGLEYRRQAVRDALIDSENRVCQQQNPAKSTPWIPACAEMTIFSAYP
jgi:hypothetical protein